MEKKVITFQADGQILLKTDKNFLFASNIVSYINAEFTLGDNWTGFDAVRAVWKTATDQVSMVLDEEGKCEVPAEVLRYPSRVLVNLVGSTVVDGVLQDRLTTYPCHAFTIDQSAHLEGSYAPNVSPSLFEQYVSMVKGYWEDIHDYRRDAEAWAVGERNGEAVSEDDDTYHNNSKYYAEQALAHENESNGYAQQAHEYLNTLDEHVADNVDEWLTEHPEATTTVQDHSLTYEKLVIGTLGYVTPEMFGAKGDGVADDTVAWQTALNNGRSVIFADGNYKISAQLSINSNTIICGDFTIYDFVPKGTSDVASVFSALNKENITICGGTIHTELSSTTITNKAEISIVNSQHIYIKEITIENASGTYGIRCSACDDVMIDGCVINVFNHIAIVNANGGNNFTVQNCEIYDVNTQDTNTYGIMLNGYDDAITASTVMGKNLKAICNHIKYTNPWWEAIDSHGGENVIVKNNFLENVHDGIAVYDDPNRHFTLSNCLIDSNIIICATAGDMAASSHFGLNTGGDNVSVSNNIIVNGGNRGTNKASGGMLLQNARNCKVFNNQILNSKSNGIYISQADYLYISENIIKHVSRFNNESFIIQFANGVYDTVRIESNEFEDAVCSFFFPNVTVNPNDAYFKVINNEMKSVGDGIRMNLCVPDKYSTFTLRGRKGDIIINSSPTTGQPIGWICSVESSTQNGSAEYKALANL